MATGTATGKTTGTEKTEKEKVFKNIYRIVEKHVLY
jgi:hypothetical protein